MNQPTVSVIIPVFNDAAGLRLCLSALADQRGVDLWETVVVDNASTVDFSPLRAEFPNVVWAVEKTPGSYAARNKGLSISRGRLLAFLDADCVPRPDWLANGLRRLGEDPKIGVVGGAVELTTHDPKRPTWAETFQMHGAFPIERYVSEGFAITGNLFTRRAVFDQVGPFRADLRSSGDREWGGRVRAAGLGILFAPDAVVGHPARRTLRQLRAKERRIAGGHRDLGLAPEATSLGKHVRTTLWVAAYPLYRLRRNLRNFKHRGRGNALRIHAVAWILASARVTELWRLRLGGKSRR